MRFILDENMPRPAARMLDAFDHENEVLSIIDELGPGLSDEEWMRRLAELRPPPTIVSGDGRILRNRSERRVLKECGLMFVALSRGWTNLRWEEMAWKLVKAWPSIAQEVNRARRSTVFEVKVGGLKIQRLCALDEL